MRTPRKGTVLRAVFDAEHARWCGPDCPPSCRTWAPDAAAMIAAIDAVQAWDNQRFQGAQLTATTNQGEQRQP